MAQKLKFQILIFQLKLALRLLQVITKSVFDNSDKLVGMISKREIEKAHKKTRDLIKISDIMYTKFHTAQPDEYIYSVIQKMNSHPFDTIPIVDPENSGKVIGIITDEGIMELLTDIKSK